MITHFQFLEVLLLSCYNSWSFPTLTYSHVTAKGTVSTCNIDHTASIPKTSKFLSSPCLQAKDQNPQQILGGPTHCDPNPLPHSCVTWCRLVSSGLWPPWPSLCPLDSQPSCLPHSFHMLFPLPRHTLPSSSLSIYFLVILQISVQGSSPQVSLSRPPAHVQPLFYMFEEHNDLSFHTLSSYISSCIYVGHSGADTYFLHPLVSSKRAISHSSAWQIIHTELDM